MQSYQRNNGNRFVFVFPFTFFFREVKPDSLNNFRSGQFSVGLDVIRDISLIVTHQIINWWNFQVLPPLSRLCSKCVAAISVAPGKGGNLFVARWRSLVSRLAHNQQYAGSNPARATNYSPSLIVNVVREFNPRGILLRIPLGYFFGRWN